MFDWDDLRIFLAVARVRSIRGAARTLALDATTVSRRIARLEARLDCTLFDLAGNQRRLTAQGERLLIHAEETERSAIAAVEEVAGRASTLAGHVRVSVAESVATALLAPAMPMFVAEFPAIEIDLVTGLSFLSPSKREADIAVMMDRPRTGNVTASRLTEFTLRLYGSSDYVARHTEPMTPSDLRGHRLIGYVFDFLPAGEIDFLDPIYRGRTPTLRTTSLNVLQRLISAGSGLGVLPSFVGRTDPRLVEILPGHAEIRREFWLVTHHDSRILPRVKAVSQWIASCLRDLG